MEGGFAYNGIGGRRTRGGRAPEGPEGEGGGPEAAPGPTPAPAAELPAAAPAAALAAAARTATPAVPPPWEEVETAALLEAEKLKASESEVNGAALPESWVDLSIEDRILQFHPAVEVFESSFDRGLVGHTDQ